MLTSAASPSAEPAVDTLPRSGGGTGEARGGGCSGTSLQTLSRPLHNSRHALPARRTNRNQRPPLHLRRQLLRRQPKNPRPRRRKRMPVRQTRPLGIELAPVDRAQRRVPPEHVAAIIRVLPRL